MRGCQPAHMQERRAPLESEAGQHAGAERLLDESKGGCNEQEAQQGVKQLDDTAAKVPWRFMPDPCI